MACQSEDSVRQDLQRVTSELHVMHRTLENERKKSADLCRKIEESVEIAASKELATRKELLHSQIRLDKTKADLDYAWIQVKDSRKQKEDLMEENAEIRRCIDDSIWNPERLNDLLAFISGLDHYVRFRMLQTLLMCEAEQGRMLEFVRSLSEDLGKSISETIVDAFVIHKLESDNDPMELLKVLAQQRIQVLGQKGKRQMNKMSQRNLKVKAFWLLSTRSFAKFADFPRNISLVRRDSCKSTDEAVGLAVDEGMERPSKDRSMEGSRRLGKREKGARTIASGGPQGRARYATERNRCFVGKDQA